MSIGLDRCVFCAAHLISLRPAGRGSAWPSLVVSGGAFHSIRY